MCGACGSGVATAPWEADVFGDSAAARRRLAAAVARSAGSASRARVKSNPFGAGYIIEFAGGRRVTARTLDEAVDAMQLPPFALETASYATGGDEDALADALVAASRARRVSPGRVIQIDHADTDFVLTLTNQTVQT